MTALQLEEGTIIAETGFVITAVYYPYRKSADAYIALPQTAPLMHCLQCGCDFYAGPYTLIAHVRSHDRRKKVRALS